MWGRCTIVMLAACGRIGFDPLGGQIDDAGPVGNRVFVTSSTQAAASLGGLAGADAICMNRAREAGLTGKFVAWLSTSMIDARDRLGSARGWYRTDGQPFVDSVAQLVGGGALLPPGVDEHGVDLGEDGFYVTSGTYQGSANTTCTDYTDPAGVANAGLAYFASDAWSNQRGVLCNEATRLTCFQTDYSIPLTYSQATGRLAFISTGVFDPSTGIGAADSLCMGEAASAGIGGTFLALLQDGAPAGARFNANGPTWVRRDGIALAPTAADFLAGHPTAQLNVQLDGTYRSEYAITGGLPDDVDPFLSCDGWSNANGSMERGHSAGSGSSAFAQTSGLCTPDPVYCLQN